MLLKEELPLETRPRSSFEFLLSLHPLNTIWVRYSAEPLTFLIQIVHCNVTVKRRYLRLPGWTEQGNASCSKVAS
jgi:hypothetical protein